MERLTVNGRQAGFTYIGLLIGVAIMGAVLAAVGTVWHTMVQREHEGDLLFVGNQFRVALNQYFRDNQRYPTDLDQLVLDKNKEVVKRHLRKIYFDPMTNQIEWGTVKRPDGQIVGIYSLSDATPLKTSSFRTRDAGLEGAKKYSEWLFMAEGQTVMPSTSNDKPKSSP